MRSPSDIPRSIRNSRLPHVDQDAMPEADRLDSLKCTDRMRLIAPKTCKYQYIALLWCTIVTTITRILLCGEFRNEYCVVFQWFWLCNDQHRSSKNMTCIVWRRLIASRKWQFPLMKTHNWFIPRVIPDSAMPNQDTLSHGTLYSNLSHKNYQPN
jgi:hypothetical protein